MQRTTVLVATAAALVLVAVSVASASADPAQQRRLNAVTGAGSGMVSVRPTSAHPGLSSEITVNVHGAAANTTFYLQRSADVGRPLAADGICQRAAGLWPWELPNSAGFGPAPIFVSFPLPLAGPLDTLTTDADGSGLRPSRVRVPGDRGRDDLRRDLPPHRRPDQSQQRPSERLLLRHGQVVTTLAARALPGGGPAFGVAAGNSTTATPMAPRPLEERGERAA